MKDLRNLNQSALSNEFTQTDSLLSALKNHSFRVLTQVANIHFKFTDEQLDELEMTYSEVHKRKELLVVFLN